MPFSETHACINMKITQVIFNNVNLKDVSLDCKIIDALRSIPCVEIMQYVTGVEIWNHDLNKIPQKGQVLKSVAFIIMASYGKEMVPLCASYSDKCTLFAFPDNTVPFW